MPHSSVPLLKWNWLDRVPVWVKLGGNGTSATLPLSHHQLNSTGRRGMSQSCQIVWHGRALQAGQLLRMIPVQYLPPLCSLAVGIRKPLGDDPLQVKAADRNAALSSPSTGSKFCIDGRGPPAAPSHNHCRPEVATVG